MVEAIKGNGWFCHFFAIEVGARGFNSTHVPFCLKSLGFSPRLVKSLLGKLSGASLEASYCIWLARSNREWKPPLVNWKTSYRPRSTPALTVPPESWGTRSARKALPRKVPPAPEDPSSSVARDEVIDLTRSARKVLPRKAPPAPKGPSSSVTREEGVDFVVTPLSPEKAKNISKPPISSKTSTAKASGTIPSEQAHPVLPFYRAPREFPFRRPWLGLKNYGSTCYANSVLNCLFPFPELWDFSASQLHPLHQALRAILLSMNVQPRDPSKATPLQPGAFLQALAGHMSKLQGTPFRCNIQHDASEVLGYVLNELLSAGVNREVVCSSLTTSYRCLVCHTTKPAYVGEVVEPIINLSVRDSLSTALRDRLSGGTVTVRCDSCNSNQDCIEQSSFLNLPDVLIFRIRRDQFSGVGGGYRSGIKMEYERNLTINSGEGEGTSSAAYHLIAVSHHVGQSFSSGHYTTTLLDPRGSDLMWKYDDVHVTKTKVLDNKTSFILLYRKERRR